jgi:transposase-like protein
MDQRTTKGSLTSSPTWEGLHEWLRDAIQAVVQEALEAEVTEFLGRLRYQRRAAVGRALRVPERWRAWRTAASRWWPWSRGTGSRWRAGRRCCGTCGIEEKVPKLVIGDGHLGIWGALWNVWPDADQQRCWKGTPTKSSGLRGESPKILNVLAKLPRTQHVVAKSMLSAIAYAATEAEACEKRREFEAWCRKRGYTQAAETVSRDWERMLTFYRYPKEHWVHLRTTNIVESPLLALRLRTDAAKRFKRVERATAVIWKMLMLAQKRFRRLNAPELLAKVCAGVQYKDGIEVAREEAAA